MSAWFVQLMGETLGPVAGAELLNMAATGRIQQDTLVSHHAEGPWVTALHVKGLFDSAALAAAIKDSHHRESAPNRASEQPAERIEPEIASGSSKGGDQPPSPSSPRPYKVLTQRDKWFAGKFDPERLEDAINAYAADGWKVCGVATTMFGTPAGKREEVVVLMERPVAS